MLLFVFIKKNVLLMIAIYFTFACSAEGLFAAKVFVPIIEFVQLCIYWHLPEMCSKFDRHLTDPVRSGPSEYPLVFSQQSYHRLY